MRSVTLEAALAEFVEDAGAHLQRELDAGAEVPFELASQSTRRRPTPLYCYRPLTGEFIQARLADLTRLPSHARARELLEDFEGLDRYLLAHDVRVARGDRGIRARAALAALLEDVFAEQSDFEPHPERLRNALTRLGESGFTSASELTLLATLHGVTMSSPELALAPGLVIAHPDALNGVPPAASVPAEDEAVEHLLVAFTAEAIEVPEAIGEATAVMRELLRALRLFGDGRVSLGAVAWSRVGAGTWSPLSLGVGGRPHGMLVVTPDQEDELRAFCNLVSRRAPRDNELAWALARFEMGCERPREYEALSDYLLALRALLEPEGPSSGRLAGRVAALCATPDRHLELTERVLRALALEHATIAGTAVEHAAEVSLVRDLGGHLRALLRDVICGHLDPDLVALADELLDPEPAYEADEPDDLHEASRPQERHGRGLHAPEPGVQPIGAGGADDDPWETDQLQLAGLPG